MQNIESVGDSYSDIISPHDYNRIISKEHLYITASDNVIAQLVKEVVEKNKNAEIVEIGSGPGRITDKIHKIAAPAKITCVDTDPVFLDFARTHAAYPEKTSFIKASALSYTHPKPVDIFYSPSFPSYS